MQNDKQLDSEVVRNADYEVFLTSGAPGYLEYAGTAQGRHVTIDADKGDLERCHRMEVRETRLGFEIHKASFERAVDWTAWRETLRERQGIEHNRQKAVELVKSAGNNRVELAAEFRAAIVAAELERVLPDGRSCDWCGTDLYTVDDHKTVDREPMCNPCHDEYFPESAASKEQPLKPRGFIGRDILATIENERSNDGEKTQMNNELLRAGYDAQQLRIEQLESWIEQSITRPSMSRELRLQGLELIEARSPEVRLAVERICPQRTQWLGQTLEIER